MDGLACSTEWSLDGPGTQADTACIPHTSGEGTGTATQCSSSTARDLASTCYVRCCLFSIVAIWGARQLNRLDV